MTTGSQDGRRDDIILNSARQACLDRLREAPNAPDALDVLVVGQWLWESRVTQELIPATIRQAVRTTLEETPPGREPKAVLRRYGPHWGYGAGGMGALIALIEAVAKVLR